MTNEELKKKIVEVVLNSEITGIQVRAITGGYSMANNIADALIAAGIGDTTNLIVENEVLQRDVENLSRTLEEGTEEFQEVQHRAEVAERALKNAIKYYGFEFCPDPDCIPINECGSEGCIEHLQEGWIKQAEGELAEEMKE